MKTGAASPVDMCIYGHKKGGRVLDDIVSINMNRITAMFVIHSNQKEKEPFKNASF